MRIFILLLMPFLSNSQVDSSLFKVPIKDNSVLYEKVIYIDSVNNQEKIYNYVKAALIKNTNYKVSKIEEDRTLGNLSSQLDFTFIAKPGIAKLTFYAKTLLSIDVKPNRYRIRLYNNSSYFSAMGAIVNYNLNEIYFSEINQFYSGKWKLSKSIVMPWVEKLNIMIHGFPILIDKGVDDEF